MSVAQRSGMLGWVAQCWWVVTAVAMLAARSPAAVAQTRPGADSTSLGVAARASAPPKIDGRDDDSVWGSAPVIRAFRMFSPREDAAPTIRTEARILYDDHALYVLVRSFDEHPDSIVRLLARRDTDGPPNDQVLLFIDTYHDRRSGYNFNVNPAGVKSDYLLFDDIGSDQSWDGIWNVGTAVDSLGWVAEFAIPLHQFRFSDRQAPTFGLMIGRWVGRSDERVSWPLYRRSRAGLVSQLGTLTGLSDLALKASLEITPYALVRSRNSSASGAAADVETRPALGADLKWVPRPSISISATLNPDFGQVEADPAVLDLTGLEVFQAERRPFFLEGAGLLSMPLAADGSARLFYSRRIGRRPALLDDYGAADSPTETTILGAAKVTARLGPAMSLAMLSAVTQAEHGALRSDGNGRQVIEPLTHYGALRLQRDFREGRSGLGMMLTRVDRAGGDSLTGAIMPSAAHAVALTTQHQTRDGAFQVSAWGAVSDVRGSADAIAKLQLSPVHSFQRPDDGVAYDPARTVLRGSAMNASAAKVGGGITRFNVSYRRISTGFDVNDSGFLTKEGVQSWSSEAGLSFTQSGRLFGLGFRRADISVGFGGDWSAGGLPYARGFSAKASLQAPSQARIQGTFVAQLPGAYCSICCTRGGPALYDPPRQTATLDLNGTTRHALIPHLSLEWHRDDGGRSRGFGGQVDATWRLRSYLNVSLAAYAFDAHYAWHHYGRFGDPLSDTTHYTVARLDQVSRAFTARLNYTITRALTVQWYAQAYISRGVYSDVREIADPRARDVARRFRAYADSAVVAQPGGIDFKQFRSNLVLRWEYRPGSTFFVVWSQGRDVVGTASATPGLWPGRDLRDLFGTAPTNSIAIKGSYWLSL